MKKNITIAICVFATIFMISIVYAAANGSLTSLGEATFTSQADVDLIIVDADFSSSTPPRIGAEFEEYVEVPGTLDGGDSHTMYISVDLLYPGDKRIVVFKLQNIETVSAKLGAWQTDDPDLETTGIKIIWPDLNGVTILSGQTSSQYQIEIEWDIENYSPGQSGSQDFSATITYQQGT